MSGKKCKNCYQANILRRVYCCTAEMERWKRNSRQFKAGCGFFGPEVGNCNFCGSEISLVFWAVFHPSSPVWGKTFWNRKWKPPSRSSQSISLCSKSRDLWELLAAQLPRFDSFAANRRLNLSFSLPKNFILCHYRSISISLYRYSLVLRVLLCRPDQTSSHTILAEFLFPSHGPF